MIQILPQEVTPGQQITRGLNTGLSGLLQQFQQQKSAENLGKVLGLEEEELKSFSKLPIEQQKIAADIIKQREKTTKQLITPEAQKDIGNVINRQIELMNKGNLGLKSKGTRFVSPQTREDIAEFNNLSGRIEAALLPLMNKGVLSKPRFDYIISMLPKAGDTLATSRGKLKAISHEFGLSEPDFGGLSEKENFKGTGQRTVLMTAPDGSQAYVPYNSQQMKSALKAGAKIVRGK